MEDEAREAFESVKEQISTELSDLRAYMDARFDKVEERFNRLEDKIDEGFSFLLPEGQRPAKTGSLDHPGKPS